MRHWLCVLCAVLLAACSGGEQVFRQEVYVFGTRVDLTVYGGSQADAEAAMGEVAREFDRLHQAFHAWQPSELSALNAALAMGESFEVSEEMAQRLRDAQQLAARGDYLFDPGSGALIELWGFHADSYEPRRPDAAKLAVLVAAHPSVRDLVIEGRRVSSRNPATQIDFGGYAKGYALDRAAAILRARGVHNALINIGGNVMALGAKGRVPWRIGIQHPREPRPLVTLPLYDGEAIGTSGDYQRYFELDGVRYSHLIDPRSGEPAHGTQALSVLVTPREHAGVLSDAASKPAFIAGADWRAYTRRFDIDHALRVAADGSVDMTRALRARVQVPGDVTVRVVE